MARQNPNLDGRARLCDESVRPSQAMAVMPVATAHQGISIFDVRQFMDHKAHQFGAIEWE